MKKIFLSLILVSLLALPIAGLAQVTPTTAPEKDIMVVLGNILNWMFTILLIVAAFFIMIAAFNFITAAGDPEKVKTARNFVLYALIGVLVAFAAKGLVKLIGTIVG
jgi:hypothetical protein